MSLRPWLVSALALLAIACGPGEDRSDPAAEGSAAPPALAEGEDAVENRDGGEIVAKVNGEPIVRHILASQADLAAAEGPPEDGEEKTAAQRAADRLALEAEQLRNLISLELAGQEALRLGYAPEGEELSQALELYKKDFEAPEQLYRALDRYGSTEEDLKRQLNLIMALKKWQANEFLAEMAVSDAEARQFYQANSERLRHGEMVRFRQILAGVSLLASPAAKAQARAKAEEALKRLEAGEDFEAVAAEVNSDPEAAANRGDLGWFVRGQSFPTVEAAAWNLPIGGRTGVVESILGFHIVKVIGRRPAGAEPFEALKPDIVEFISARKREAAVERRVKELTGAADIEIFDEALKKALDAAPSAAPAAE